MPLSTLLVVLAVGATTGFLGGLFGKGGSALATPVLAAFGVPPIVAVAGPLPATIPGTLVAARQYWRERLVDRRVAVWCLVIGLPATVLGAVLTRWIPAGSLVRATDLLVGGLGVGILVGARRRRSSTPASGGDREPDGSTAPASGARSNDGDGSVLVEARPEADRRAAPTPALLAVAAGVGLVAGLLANSGGFLLAPLFLLVLRLPVRSALGTSLAVSAALAVPGTVTHAALGHIDWTFVAVFATASVPLAAVGARTALAVDPERLEVGFGAALVLLASALLVWG